MDCVYKEKEFYGSYCTLRESVIKQSTCEGCESFVHPKGLPLGRE